jgi:hypothetical protein
MDAAEFQSGIERAIAMLVLVAPAPFLAATAIGAFFLSFRGRLGGIGMAVVSFRGGRARSGTGSARVPTGRSGERSGAGSCRSSSLQP